MDPGRHHVAWYQPFRERLAVALVLMSLLRHLGNIYTRLDSHVAPPTVLSFAVGDTLPNIELTTLTGERVATAAFQGLPAQFLVVSPECPPCHDLLAGLAARGVDPSIRPVIISLADRATTTARLDPLKLDATIPVLIDEGGQVRAQWGIDVLPSTVHVDSQLRVTNWQLGVGQGIAAAVAEPHAVYPATIPSYGK